MPLDNKLAERYGALFAIYGTGGSPLVAWTKNHIIELGDDLREDAQHFLLTSLDQMIIQPICGYIPQRGGVPMELHNSEDSVRQAVVDVIDIIMDSMRTNEQPKFSANAVIRAIAARRQTIADKVAWWRED